MSEDTRGRKSTNNVLRDDNAAMLKNASDICMSVANDGPLDGGSGGDFISLTQAMERSEKISYGFATSSKHVTSQTERSQPIRSSPRQKKKSTISALDRLLCTKSRQSEGLGNVSNSNSGLNMLTKTTSVSDKVVVEQEQQRRKIEIHDDLGASDRIRLNTDSPVTLVKAPSTTLAREFGPDSKEKKKKEDEKKVELRVSFPAPSLSWGSADEQIFAQDNIRTTMKDQRSVDNNEKKRKATHSGARTFLVEDDPTSKKKSPPKEFIAEWDDDEDDEIIENHDIYLNNDSITAIKKTAFENSTVSASRVVNALKMDSSDINFQEKMMKKLERIDAQGARIDAQRVIRIQKDDATLHLHVVSCCESKCRVVPKVITLKDHWIDIQVQVSDLIRIHSIHKGQEISGNCEITATNGLILILHPELLLSATMLGGSFQCLRKAFINTVIGDGPGGDASEAATFGTLLHELAEKSLIISGSSAMSNNLASMDEKCMEDYIVGLARKSALDLYAINKAVDDFIDHARNVISGVEKWSKKLTALSRKARIMARDLKSKISSANGNEDQIANMREEYSRRFNQPCGGVHVEVRKNGASNSNVLEVSEIVDIEEIIWAPRLGLKGQIDAIAEARIRNGKQSTDVKVVPVELKTGKWKDVVEHGAQVLLYTLMIGERYFQNQGASPFGILHYTNDDQNEEGKTTVIERTNLEIAFLMHQRNRLAAALQPRDDEESSPDQNRFPYSTENMIERAQLPPAHSKLASGILPNMSPSSWCERCFQRESCFTLHKSLESGNEQTSGLQFFGASTDHITKSHSEWLNKWIRLVDLESSASHGKRATPWMDVEVVCSRKGGIAVNGLKLVHHNIQKKISLTPENGTPRRDSFTGVSPGNTVNEDEWFHEFLVSDRSNEQCSLSKFSPGDRVVLSRNDGLMVTGRATIEKVEINHNILSLVTSRPLRVQSNEHMLIQSSLPGSASPNELWRIDRDGAGHAMAARSRGNLIATLAKDVSQNKNQKTMHIPTETRRRIIDFEEPVFEKFSSIKLPGRYNNNFAEFEQDYLDIVVDLNEEQRYAVEKVVTCSDYALVLGLPGAGKSETLVCCILVLALLEKRVLITSHTHNAVDNILKRLPSKKCESFIRIGDDEFKVLKEVRKYRLGGEIWDASSFDAINYASEKARIVGATCYALNHPFFARKEFDVVLVDEAGQLTLPAILGPLLISKTFALVGDHHQLPPLITSEIARRSGMEDSLFAQLCNKNPDAVCSLTCQYRMNEPLTKLPNALTYDGKLKPANDAVARKMLSVEEDFDVKARKIKWLTNATSGRPDKAVIFLDTSAEEEVQDQTREIPDERPVNKGEQRLVLEIVRSLIRRKVEAAKIAVLSPFNAQVDEIAELLKSDEKVSDVESLTIDKAQGRDFDAVVISFVKSNSRGDTTELLEDKRRLNVAITRAKSKLILIGNMQTLRSSNAMSKMLDVVVSEKMIEPVDNSFVQLFL